MPGEKLPPAAPAPPDEDPTRRDLALKLKGKHHRGASEPSELFRISGIGLMILSVVFILLSFTFIAVLQEAGGLPANAYNLLVGVTVFYFSRGGFVFVAGFLALRYYNKAEKVNLLLVLSILTFIVSMVAFFLVPESNFLTILYCWVFPLLFLVGGILRKTAADREKAEEEALRKSQGTGPPPAE